MHYISNDFVSSQSSTSVFRIQCNNLGNYFSIVKMELQILTRKKSRRRMWDFSMILCGMTRVVDRKIFWCQQPKMKNHYSTYKIIIIFFKTTQKMTSSYFFISFEQTHLESWSLHLESWSSMKWNLKEAFRDHHQVWYDYRWLLDENPI